MSSDDGLSGSADEPPQFVQYVIDIFGSAGAVILIGLLLFTVSGVWPPLVAIESPSMDPHIERGDLVFVMEAERFAGPNAEGGVVTAAAADGYIKFQQPGDVIVYEPDGSKIRTPIIHRAMFYVEDGENWYNRADTTHLLGADNCEELTNCPSPHAGFVTKGDNNNQYDQVGASPISEPVKIEWVVGTAEHRVPLLGEIRLGWNQAAGNTTGPVAG